MLIEISIPKFEEYNPRKDRAKHSWYRAQNDWFDDPKLFDCDSTHRYIYISLIGIVNGSGTDGTFSADLDWFAKKLDIKPNILKTALEKLEKNQLVVVSGNQAVTNGYRSGANGITTNERTNVFCPKNSDGDRTKLNYEELYLAYGVKKKKQPFLKACKTKIKTQENFDNFKTAAINYHACLKAEKKQEYTMLPTTFLNEWSDWLDPSHGYSTTSKQTKKASIDDWDTSGIDPEFL